MHSLTLNTVGQGTVISQPLAGINCQPQCQADYLPNQKVKLQAQPDPNYLFLGWSEDCQGLNRQTTVVMDAAKTCTATFQLYNPTDLFTLTLTKTGLGRGKIWGRVQAEKTSLACQSKCQQIQQTYAAGSPVILTVHPDNGFIFTGWSGDCSTVEAKTIILMTAAKNCTANFDLDPNLPLYPLTVQIIGTGKGKVTGPAWAGGQDCGNDCTAYYPADDTARLRARPAPCSTFLGWSGDCQGDKLGTTLTMTKEQVCYAHFQSELEQVATSLIDEFYAQATLSSGAIAERYPRVNNELRLKEAFWLAQVPLMQIDQHLQATQLWPSQFNDLTQYGMEPVGEYTHSLTIRSQWLEIQVELQNAQGVAELVGILVYYGLTPPPAAGDLVPVWLPREVLGQW
ncbi:MAG: hypothetical protein HC877_14880 [Thioploca sp.]|nr:hypothetical protein [Thioploca sp.]